MLIKKSDKESSSLCADFLLENRLVIIPTDTVYGFSGLTGGMAEDELFKIKGREKSKKFISLAAEPEDVLPFIKMPRFKNFQDLWRLSIPVTIVFETASGSDTAAFRCPSEIWLKSVLKKIGKPIFSTSVNYSGKAAMTDISEIINEFEKKVPLIVEDGNIENTASAIVDLSGEKPRILRQGKTEINLSAILRE